MGPAEWLSLGFGVGVVCSFVGWQYRLYAVLITTALGR